MNLGKIVMDLAPNDSEGNPRNSEGAFLALDDGSILFAYSRFKGDSAADYASSDIYALYSYDEGATFTDEKVLLTCEEEKMMNLMSVSLLRMKNGEIGLFYLGRSSKSKLQMFLRTSRDKGAAWSERILCTPAEGVFVVNNDRVIRLQDGRILIPAALHRPTEDGYEEFGELRFFYSDDDGATWKQSAGRCSLPYYINSSSGLQEPGVVERHPGILWCWARTDLGRQYEAYSFDRGETWSSVQPSGFTGPKSPLSMKGGPDGRLYAVWNPVPEYNGQTDLNPNGIFLGGRTPYVIAASDGQRVRFTQPCAFETERGRGYCYCAVCFLQDSLLLAYCAGGIEDGSCLKRCRIRKIPMSQLETVLKF